MNLFDLLIALAEFTLAGLLFNRMLFAVASNGRRSGMSVWLLAVTLALMGAGRFDGFLAQSSASLIYTLAHITLIAFALDKLIRWRAEYQTDWRMRP